jgi:hypothetical protein
MAGLCRCRRELYKYVRLPPPVEDNPTDPFASGRLGFPIHASSLHDDQGALRSVGTYCGKDDNYIGGHRPPLQQRRDHRK